MTRYPFIDRLPFRLGTSSYIIPADILPNVHFLAERVWDVELVLFDVDEYCNIPDAAQLAELNQIAAASQLSYTVHLPLDLKLSEDGEQLDVSMEKALKVIQAVSPLRPFSYTLHLDSHSIQMNPTAAEAESSVVRCTAALEQLVSRVPADVNLSVENLESYPPEMNYRVLDALSPRARAQCSDCIDIGHLWLQGREVVPLLRDRLRYASVIHLHGIGSRDHQSLSHVELAELKRVLDCLIAERFAGVVTLEVFSQEDFESSMERIAECL